MNQTFDIYVIWDVKCSLDFNLNVYFLKYVKKMPEYYRYHSNWSLRASGKLNSCLKDLCPYL